MFLELFLGVMSFLGLIAPIEPTITSPPLVEGDLTALIALPLIDTPISNDMASSSPNEVKCSCIEFVRKLIINQFPKVNEAKEIPVISDSPTVGSVAIFNYAPSGHAAFVESVGEADFGIIEFNFKRCLETRRRVRRDDQFLLGFWN